MVNVYEADGVSQVKALHTALLSDYPGQLTVIEVLKSQAAPLLRAHEAGNAAACIQLSNWLPRAVGRPAPEILARSLSADEAHQCVAREHGFDDWSAVTAEPLDPEFEAAATAVVSGDLGTLASLLESRPELVHVRSAYGHRCTLLHYVAANGVQTWRQTVPSNAAQITAALLAAGADRRSRAAVFGGEYDTLALLASSAHPANAGVTDQVADLVRFES